jgi:hypothetical protein
VRLVGLCVCSSVDQQSLARAAIHIRPYTTSPNISTYNNSRMAHSQDCNRNMHFQQSPRVGAPSHLHTAMINTLDTNTAKEASDKGSPSPKRSAHARAEQNCRELWMLGVISSSWYTWCTPQASCHPFCRTTLSRMPRNRSFALQRNRFCIGGFSQSEAFVAETCMGGVAESRWAGSGIDRRLGFEYIYSRGIACGGVLGRKI